MSSSSLVVCSYFQICKLVLENFTLKSSNSIFVTIVVVKGGHFWFCILCVFVFYGSPFEKFEDLGLQVFVICILYFVFFKSLKTCGCKCVCSFFLYFVF